MKKTGLIVTGLVVAVLAIIITIYGFSISNQEIKLKNLALAQQENCKSYFDKMFKILQQEAGVADQYKESFKEIYPKLMEGRYGSEKGNALMKWVQESNPNFDISLYSKLMNSIEAQREGFFNEQKKLISINNEHRNLLETAPSKFFVGGRDTLSIQIITSLKTKNVYSSGEENDIDLFKK